MTSRIDVQITMPGLLGQDDPGEVWFFVQNPGKAYFPTYQRPVRSGDTWMLVGVQLGRDATGKDLGRWSVQAIYLSPDDAQHLHEEITAGAWNTGRPTLPTGWQPLKQPAFIRRTC